MSTLCHVLLFFLQDKTFGLKNKKGAKQQKFIKNVTQQVKYGQQSARQVGGSSSSHLFVICPVFLASHFKNETLFVTMCIHCLEKF